MKKLSMTNKRIVIFLLITTVFLIILSFRYSQGKNPSNLILLMFTPMISVVATRLITREGMHNTFIRPIFRKNKKYYLMSYLFTPIIAFAGAGIYFILFPGQLNLLDSKFAFQMNAGSTGEYFKQLAIVIPLCILINPIGGGLSSFGEEFAWRGYLLPKLSEQFSTRKAIILTGIIWGIWHAPIIYMGFNYGTKYPILGIIMMIFFCSVINIILSYLFLQTNTVWVPVVAHASINAIDQYTPSYLFTSMNRQSNFFIGPNLIGIIGGLGFILVAVYCYYMLQGRSAKV